MFEIVQESVKVCTTGMSSRTLYTQHPASLRVLPSLPDYRLQFFIAKQIQYSSINRLYAQNVSVKVYLHMYNGNVQQNPLCVESCVTKEFSISARLWRTIFDPDESSVLSRAHLRTAVDSMRRKPCVRNCSRGGSEQRECPNIRSKKYRI